ncbi:hypothetical protein B0H14DRAFT_1248154 [Mycena olivaceomarginata]|nr:hypothetical protein B0H14DRAFT_1248154 [Mycena olivaceomarginata]
MYFVMNLFPSLPLRGRGSAAVKATRSPRLLPNSLFFFSSLSLPLVKTILTPSVLQSTTPATREKSPHAAHRALHAAPSAPRPAHALHHGHAAGSRRPAARGRRPRGRLDDGRVAVLAHLPDVPALPRLAGARAGRDGGGPVPHKGAHAQPAQRGGRCGGRRERERERREQRLGVVARDGHELREQRDDRERVRRAPRAPVAGDARAAPARRGQREPASHHLRELASGRCAAWVRPQQRQQQ